MKNQTKGFGIITAGALALACSSPLVYADMNKNTASETMHEAKHTAQHKMDRAEVAVKDAWLDGKLESAFLFNEHLNSFEIDTEVKNRVAYLSGHVESAVDKDLAGEIALSVDGIESVRNELKLDPAKVKAYRGAETYAERNSFRDTVMNATLTARVKSQLLLNDNTSGLQINVDSKNGDVTLSGKVASAAEKELAGAIADNTDGATTVHNRLIVSAK